MEMRNEKRVYQVMLSGRTDALDMFVHSKYPECGIHSISIQALHKGGVFRKLQLMRRAKGEALAIASDHHFADGRIPNEMIVVGLAGRCRKVAYIGGPDNIQELTRVALWCRIPKLIVCGIVDSIAIGLAYVVLYGLRLWLRVPAGVRKNTVADIDIAHLYPRSNEPWSGRRTELS